MHSDDDWSGQTLCPALLALGGTYVYLGKECAWKHELYSLSLSCLHESGKLMKPENEMDDDLSNLFEKVSSLKKYAKFKIYFMLLIEDK